jgi:four helix bundle protein
MTTAYKDLIAWQRGMDLAIGCYALSGTMRRQRHGALAAQLQRAAISVPANIAEGKGRGTKRDYARFLSVALGSLKELETLVEIAQRVGAAKVETCTELLKLSDEVGRVTYGLRRALVSAK